MKPTAKSVAVGVFLGDGVRDASRGARRILRRARGGARAIRYYHRIDDPRSYLYASVLPAFVEAYGLDVEVILVPEPSADVEPEPALRAAFDVRDTRAICARLGVPFPEPGTAPLPTRVRLANALGLAAGRGRAKVEHVARLSRHLLGGEADALAALADREPAAHGEDVRPALEAGYRRLIRDGFYVGATVVFEGEAYHGVERLVHLERRLVAEGVPDRALAHRFDVVAPHTGGPRRKLTTFFSFRSPYSYLGVERLASLASTHDLDLELRSVYPMVMRGLRVPAAKRLYIVRDVKREASLHGVPFGRVEDPLGPAIDRCLAVFESLDDASRRLAFARAALSAAFARGLPLADDATFLAVAAEAGVSAEHVRAAERDGRYRAICEANRETMYELGLWGVPSFVLGDRTTFGQDRLGLLLGG